MLSFNNIKYTTVGPVSQRLTFRKSDCSEFAADRENEYGIRLAAIAEESNYSIAVYLGYAEGLLKQISLYSEHVADSFCSVKFK